MNMFHSLH